ncbi:hypothetical protein L2750_10830 [Shewanella submarina]|uniref:Uncharacterized protein n=1 Tax=Shewanella submarina TaxID=2016376 RepID=A0ABV7GHH7_9GAMM|nr:hypothetical protein [Shewanella submarina]MCL1037644.1 hypothetical protein [Shewanella submarina]
MNARLANYPLGLLTLSVVTLGTGLWEIGLIASLFFILSFYLDPVFRFYRVKVEGFHRFMLTAFGAGLGIAVLALLNPEHYGKLLAVWGIPTFVISFKNIPKFKKLEYK